MNLSYNFELAVSMTALFVLFSLITQPSLVSSTLTISAKITNENDVTNSPVERILSVPTSSRLELNCTNNGTDGVQWQSTAPKIPLIMVGDYWAVAIMDPFTADNSGFYTCSSPGKTGTIYVTNDEVATIASKQNYEVLESVNVVLSVCVSAYLSYQSSLVLTWSYGGVEIPSCASQAQIGCFQCEVSASDRFSSSNYSFEATALSFSSAETLTVSVHELPRLVTPLSPTMDITQCKSASIFCAVTGDPDLPVVWRYRSSSGEVTLSNGDQHAVTTSRGYEPGEVRYYTNSSLTIRSVDGDSGGEYSCVFLGFGGSSVRSSSQLLVTPNLCLKKFVSTLDNVPVPGNSVDVFQGSSPQMYSVYICIGHRVSWYQGDSLISQDSINDVYQKTDETYGTLYLIILPPPGYFYCRSETPALETWLYLTPTHPTILIRPPGLFYYPRGSNFSIYAYLSPPQGAYSLSWRYQLSETQQDVTERGWTINPQSEPGYYEVSISLSGLQELHVGTIIAEYRTQGLLDTALATVLTLPPSGLTLSPGPQLFLWEGSYLGVHCLLKNETVPVSDSPEWEGVSGCPSEVCSDNSTLSLRNVTASVGGNYSCSAANEAGEKRVDLVVAVNPFSNELILLTYKLPGESTHVQSNSVSVNASDNYTDSDRLILSCSLDNSTFSTEYLPTSALLWEYNSSLSGAVRLLPNFSLSLAISSIFYLHQNTSLSARFCCHTRLDVYREARQCILVTFDASNWTYPVTTTPPPPLHITIFMFVDNCTFLFPPDLITAIKLELLNLTRSDCGCNVSDTELHLTEHFCHTDPIGNHPLALLTLCGASTDSLYQALLNASLAKPHFIIQGHTFMLDAVVEGYEETHCLPLPPTNPNGTLVPPIVSLPVWSKIVLFGALPTLVSVLLVLCCLAGLYLCFSRACRYFDKEYRLPGSEQILQSDDLLTSSMVMLSPSQVPQNFKTATDRGYLPPLSVPQELLSRPASTPPTQGEFPVMYSNPLAFDGSGEGYTTSFTNFNDNHTYYSDMPPISETAQRMPPVFSTHKLMLHHNYSYFARDQAHSSLPSPLRTTKRNYLLQQRLAHARNNSYSPTNPYTHHQLKVAYRPSSVLRTETPTFDSGVEELDSINPRSSSSASSSASEAPPTRRLRASSLATSFPQHVQHARANSAELSRNTSLPNITEASANSFSSPGAKLELYKTVKKGQRESQTLV